MLLYKKLLLMTFGTTVVLVNDSIDRYSVLSILHSLSLEMFSICTDSVSIPTSAAALLIMSTNPEPHD